MNQNYRVIWNQSQGQFTVTSELARGKSKSSSTSGKKNAIKSLALNALTSALLLVGSVGVASAATAYGATASGAGKTVALEDQNITTTASAAHGLYVDKGASGTSNNVNFNTSGAKAYAVYVAGAGSNVDIAGGTVTTTGTTGHGLVAGNYATLNAKDMTINTTGYGVYSNSSLLTADNLNVTAIGNSNYAIFGSGADTNISLSNSKLTVSGNNSAGLYMSSGTANFDNVDITLNDSSVGMTGFYSAVINSNNTTIQGDAGGLALEAYSGSSIKAKGLSVSLDSGDSTTVDNTGISFGGYLTSANTVSLEDSNINITGNNALGVRVRTGLNTLNLTNSTINAEEGMGIYAILDTDLMVNADHSTLSGKTLLQSGDMTDPTSVVKSVTINATNQSQLVGDVNVNQAQTLASDINLDTGSTWSGASTGLHNLTLNGGSQWDVTRSSDLDNLSIDNSTLNMTAPGTGYSKVTVGNFTSNNGTVEFKTHLMDDGSQTDQLHVTGDYNGTSDVVVNNAGGTGAQTINGIQLIQVDGVVNGEFNQKGRIVAGAYDYHLVHSAANNQNIWSLSSDLAPVDPVIPVEPVVPVDPINPVDPVVNPINPVIPVDPVKPTTLTTRPEAGSYVANLAASNTLFSTSLDDRLGETSYVDALTGETKVTSLWLRNEGGHNSFKDSSGQLKTTSNRYVMQLGGDVAQWSSNGDDRFHLGVMGGYANEQSNTHSNVTGYGSKGQINGYSAGVYGSWFQDNAEKTGAYLDSWALYNWFNNSVKGQDLGEENYKSKGITASVEGGYTLKVGELNSRQSYYVQPKAQVTWMGVEANNHTESNGTQVSGEGNNNVQTRLGVRAFIKGHSKVDDGKQTTFEPFIEANWLHNTEAFGSNMNGVSIRQEGASNIGEVKVGVDAKLTNAVNLWGNVGQQMGDKGYSDSSAMVGVKVNF